MADYASTNSEWTKEKKFESNDVIVEITSLEGNYGKRYSISVGRKAVNRDTQEEYSSRFLRPRDLEIASRLCDEASSWINEDQGSPEDLKGPRR